tara:strand:- start:410 stop:757 length:348 start_codon:yes stop_codon:yes gene_type:complete
MPSEIANTIVNHIFSDEKSKAIDATNDAISATSYDMIQQKKVEFAKEWGFDPEQTGQATADEIEKVYDGQEPPELAPTAAEIAQQEQEPEVEQPEASAEPTEDQPVEEPKDETDS